MAELSTLARPYSLALFEAALKDKTGLQAWASLIAEMAQVASQADVRQALADPRLDAAARSTLLVQLLKQDLPASAQNLIALLVENDRLELLPEIAAQFAQRKLEHEGLAEAHIVSAFALNDEQLASLVTQLEKKFGVKLQVRVTVDASLIGGVRVTVGDQVLDTSVQTQLARMRDLLTAA